MLTLHANDTIAAISTGLTASGIGIVRLTGPDSYAIAAKIFKTFKGYVPDFAHSFRIQYGFIINSDINDSELDEVLVMNMKGPHSYSGEDTIEINCHGGVLMMRRVLQRVLDAGARLAEPGEFTKRAFLNGRIDLSQAEAVIDIIQSKNDKAAKAALEQLKGSVSKEIKNYREILLKDCAFIEAALDDPEHIDIDGFKETLGSDVDYLIKKIKALIDTAENGRYIREGINTVILGSPNAGKSSLLNALLEEERAIVTDIPGTTRDTLEETYSLNGLTFNFIDTAGIRETDDIIESIGVKKALERANGADLLLFIVDASKELSDDEFQILDFIRRSGKTTLILLNKSDLQTVLSSCSFQGYLDGFDDSCYISISARTGQGLDTFKEHLIDLYYNASVSFNDELTITSERQRELLLNAKSALFRVKESIENDLPEDFYTIDLKMAYDELGLVVGENAGDDLINEIFSRFCMGK